MRIAVVAPGRPIKPEVAERVLPVAAAHGADLVFHPQCFLCDGHFAGSDTERGAALVEAANDPAFDAIWFARGGYGSNRIAEWALDRLTAAAGRKIYMGYSDNGFLLAGLYRRGIGRPAHGPMPIDIVREGGEAAVARALAWMAQQDEAALEPSLTADSKPAAAFNLSILSSLLGTVLEPDLAGHVVMIEDIAEYTYRTDRQLFHVTGSPIMRRAAGIRLGRFSDVPENDADFGASEEDVVRRWCEQSGIPFLGYADIGHDPANRVVPFGI